MHVFTELNVLLAFLFLILFRLTVFMHIVDLQFEKINLSVFLCAWVVCWRQFEWTAGNKYLIILLNYSSTALLFGFLSL